MSLAEVSAGIYVDPSDVSSIQAHLHESTPSGTEYSFVGSVITTKNGRKIYVPDLTPKEIHNRLSKTTNREELK